MPGMTNRRTILATLFTCLVGLVTTPVAFGQGKTSENVVKTSVKESGQLQLSCIGARYLDRRNCTMGASPLGNWICTHPIRTA